MLKRTSAQFLTLAIILLLASSSVLAQRRIRFKRGHVSATVTGRLPVNGQRQFLLWARTGQQMSVRVTSGNNRVSFCETDGSSMDYELNYTGDQKVDICNLGRATNYRLTVTIH